MNNNLWNFDLKKEEAWFKEKYDPFLSEAIQNERLAECKKTAEKFFEEYRNNVFASICLEIKEDVKLINELSLFWVMWNSS